MTDKPDPVPERPTTGLDRREFATYASVAAMGTGLAASYGTFAFFAIRYLYAGGEDKIWQFVVATEDLAVGDSMPFVTPSGASVVVARQKAGDSADCFVALSSICPHLGCQVHWEPQNDRFFCPCHNGAFDAEGKATEGPPEKAGQVLEGFPLMVQNGLLYIEVPMDVVRPETG